MPSISLGRRFSAWAATGISLMLMAACGANAKPNAPTGAAPATQAGTPRPAHLNYVNILTFDIAPELVAQAKGFFAEQNLTVDFGLVGQSALGCQQLLAKAADIGGCSMNDMVQADEAGGAHLIVVMNKTVTALQYGAMAKSNINSWNDLKGKTVIVGGPKDNTVFYFHAMARDHGLKDTDYNFQYAGTSVARYAALKSGAVDLALLANPFDIQAEQDGFHRLDNLLPKYLNGDNYLGGGPNVNQEWAKTHSDELTRFLVAMLKSIAWVNDPANKQALFEIVGPKLNLTQEAFDKTYQLNVVDAKQWSTDGHISDGAVQGVLKGLLDLGALKEPLPPASKYYDTTYLQAALKRLGR